MLSRVSNTTVTTGTATASRGPVVGSYPCARSAASTRSRVSGATSGRWLSTLDAVEVETPAARATTCSVARFLTRGGGEPLAPNGTSSENFYTGFDPSLDSRWGTLYGPSDRNTFDPVESGRRLLEEERSQMTRTTFAAAAALAAAGAFAFAGCGSSDNTSSSSSSGSSGSNKSASSGKQKTVCAIMTDADSSSRWVHNDAPLLKKQFEAAGFKINIQNAENDTQKYATIAQQMLTSGCNLMVLTDLNGAGIQVTQQAHKQGIPVIAYDRPIKGADYYVSFDNERVGQLEGQMIVDGLKAEGKDPKTAKVVYSGGDPTDGNAAQFFGGANKVMKAAGIKPAFKTPGTWDQQKSQTFFEQGYTALHGNVDAVWAANDTNAGSAITVLDKNGKKVPVSGQDATPPGLQNVLLGKQYGTVYKPYQLEAKATVDLGQQLLQGQKPAVDKKAPDGTPFIAETPTVVTTKNMQQVFDDGNAKVSDVCTGNVKAACEKAGIH